MKKERGLERLAWDRFQQAVRFNRQIGLYDRVKTNENYFIGNQWEGVRSGGLPTPVFNFLKRVVLFQVSSITSDNISMQATPLLPTAQYPPGRMEEIASVLNPQFEAIFERNRLVTMLREMTRNAAVDGDGCMYFYFDSTVENGQPVKGEITAEVVENTRVHFGNPNVRDPQKQPWIIISRRMLADDARRLAHQRGIREDSAIRPDQADFQSRFDSYTDDKVTVLTHFWRDPESGRIWMSESTETVLLKQPTDTGLHRYPLIWLCWDYIQDCYHGQSMITGLIPNQNFINKIFALTGVSLLATAFPKVVYDRNRLPEWDGGVGTAVGVAGSVEGVAKVMNPPTVNPQVTEFMQLCIDQTQNLLGASEAALGEARPDNTSAIIALQRAANTPMELTRQSLYQAVEDMGRIFLDMIRVQYGVRYVQQGSQAVLFDFAQLQDCPIGIKLDVGASSYWSEIASLQTLEQLLAQDKISLRQYLERVPNGYLVRRQELLEELRGTPEGESGGIALTRERSLDSLPITGKNSALHARLRKMGGV